MFVPDRRNVRHQRYCDQAACRKASKAASQRRWLSKPDNRDYFKGPEQVERVRRWRAAHPGYARRGSARALALQDLLSTQVIDSVEESGHFALQDLFANQVVVLVGLIAHFTDSTLQEDIADKARRLQSLGADILANGGFHDRQTSALSRPPPARAGPL